MEPGAVSNNNLWLRSDFVWSYPHRAGGVCDAAAGGDARARHGGGRGCRTRTGAGADDVRGGPLLVELRRS